ncbi:hypothetical protein LCGC14_0164820 [marine sediment metagenome]|uniref:Uncharacterized protein n=1 Tax=marine sediment metagenome TaxID=412755 RepID=A0A0F9XWP9_9ZZZZ
MAQVNGITVDFTLSPRIITVPVPLVEISVQDLHDTLTNIEDDPHNGMQYDRLIRSAGKESLGGSIAVGITATLLNAKLAFAARGGPTFIQCLVSGGNLVAVDDVGAPISAIEPTAFTQVVTAASSSATSLDIGALTVAQFLALK